MFDYCINENVMKDFKKNIWKEDGICLQYVPLDDTHIMQIMNHIASMYDISINSLNNSSLFDNIFNLFNKEIVVLDVNSDEGFKEICTSLNISETRDESIYVIWNYDDIDRVSMNMLREFWSYIWYGVSDEMCLLYFSKSNLLLLVTDYGTIYLK